MCLLSLMCMMYLQESQDLGLFKPFIFKIQGTESDALQRKSTEMIFYFHEYVSGATTHHYWMPFMQ